MFSLLIKPIGSICNLRCEYCFYLEKAALYPDQTDFKMTDETLEQVIKQYISACSSPVVTFAWQGGEPTLMGIDFFTKVVQLQKQYLPREKQVQNVIQTNGTLLDDAWCEFFHANNFLVGISLDGPDYLHDRYRHDKQGGPTADKVLAGLKLLQQHQVEHNVLCAVSAANIDQPVTVYQFLVDQGVKFIQFIPIVEKLSSGQISDRSINGSQYGQFLTAIFDQWVVKDTHRVSVQIFDECLSAWAGIGAQLCVFRETCGLALALEHNGDLYACDHFVDPEYFLGNIHQQDMKVLAESKKIKDFAVAKQDLPKQCRDCPVQFICNGGCPKNRIDGINYLCEGYRQFFTYIDPYMQKLVTLVNSRQSPKEIAIQMQAQYQQVWGAVKRNDPCPCQSGKKYKKCCLQRNNQHFNEV